MTNTQEQINDYLGPEGPAALVIREYLMPVEGPDGVFFPSTFADIGYNIDYENPQDKRSRNIALIDSVGSQAITIKAGEKTVNLINASHRAGDAIARCSSLRNDLHTAFNEVNKGNALPLARLAPTSLVFGVWDSRGTQAKLPRLVSSTIRAYDVRKLTRSATYFAPVDYSAENIFTEEERENAEGNTKNPLSKCGFVNALAPKTHGGVIAEGGIRRDAILAISALKLLKADNEENTIKLQQYILGLALIAFTRLPLGYYRQGTILVLDPEKERESFMVAYDGARTPLTFTHEAALAFAKDAAKTFGIGEDREATFDADIAKQEIKAAKKKKG
ncbi:MAG: type I-U CRISPR-associated protein Cas7 [Desulfobacterales bacterium]|nr:MAG: type I-U CRISPR-associated protein Cas7 [Desulfobacterales bacterium]